MIFNVRHCKINAFFHEEESFIVIEILAYVSLKEKIGNIEFYEYTVRKTTSPGCYAFSGCGPVDAHPSWPSYVFKRQTQTELGSDEEKCMA